MASPPRDRDSNSNLDVSSGEQAAADAPLQSPLGDPLVTVAFLAIVLPLFFHLTVAQTQTQGTATTTRVLDYVALCGGVVADACGALLLLKTLTNKFPIGSQNRNPVRLVLAGLISAFGFLHLLRGLGLIKLGLLG